MRKATILLLALMLALAAAGCGDEAEETTTTTTTAATTTAAAATTAAAGEAVLTVGDKSFTMAELEALGVETLTLKNPSHGPTDYTGVRLTAVLAAAELNEAATTLTIIAADGFEFAAPLPEVLACADCLLAFDDDGTLRTAMPGMENKAWVKEVVEIVAS